MSEGQSQIKSLSHLVFYVTDAGRSAAFYHDVLNFDVLYDLNLGGADLESMSGLPGARGRIVVVQLGNDRIELVEFRRPKSAPRQEPPHPSIGYVNLALEVENLDAVLAGIKRRGIPYDGEPVTIQGVRMFFIRDPDGNRVEFIQYGSADAQGVGHRRSRFGAQARGVSREAESG